MQDEDFVQVAGKDRTGSPQSEYCVYFMVLLPGVELELNEVLHGENLEKTQDQLSDQ